MTPVGSFSAACDNMLHLSVYAATLNCLNCSRLYLHTLTPVPLETHHGPPISTRSPYGMDSRSTMQEVDILA